MAINEFQETIRTAIESYLIDVHTALPCEVVAVNYSNLTVDVKLVVKKIKIDDTTEEHPILTEVPIGYTQTSKYAITLPINIGDTGQLIFNERQLDNWVINNEIKEPDDTRKHSLSDALFIPNFVARDNNLANVNQNDLQIRNKNGNINLTLSDNGTITANCSNFVINASAKFEVNSPSSTFSGTVTNNGTSIDNTHIHTGDSGGSTTPPIN